MIHLTADGSQINITSASLPLVLSEANSFTLIGWFVAGATPSGDRGIIRALNGFQVNLNSSKQLRAAMLGTTPPIAVTGASNVAEGDLCLWAMHYDHPSRTVTAYFRSDSDSGTLTGTATNGAYAGQGSAGAVGSPRVGTFTMSAAIGHHAILCRNHALSLDDFNLLWSRRRFDDPLRGGAAFANLPAETYAAGSPVRFAFGFVHTLQASGMSGFPAPGSAITGTTLEIAARDAASSPELLRIVRAMGTITDALFSDAYSLAPTGGAFARNTPGTMTVGAPYYRARVSPLAHLLANDDSPTGVVRVLVPSNSRGSRLRDGANNPSAFAGGFFAARRSKVAGLGNMPPAYSGFNSGWPNIGTLISSGTITVGTNSNARRVWTGSLVSDNGPGICALMTTDGASHLERASAVPGTLMADDAAMTVARRLLRYPGSAPVEVFENSHSAETGTGTETSIDTLTLSTTEASHAVVSATSTTVVIAGDVTALYTPNKCVAVTAGTGLNSINFVASSSFGGGNTTVTLQFAWETAPNNTSTVAVGPFEVVEVSHAFPADASRPFKGLRIVRGAGLPVVLFSRDFYRPDVNGWVFMPAGWGGNGYTPQINESVGLSIQWWADALAPDLVLQFPATQSSASSSMADFTAQLRAALPGVEIVHCGDVRYPGSSFPSWQDYILNNAEANQVAAVTPFEDPEMGDREVLLCAFYLDDDPHPALRGNQRIAELTLDLLQMAALEDTSSVVPAPTDWANVFMPIKLGEIIDARKSIPFPQLDESTGDAITGQTFAPSEIKVSAGGGVETNSTGTVFEVGGGGYVYRPSAAELATPGLLLIRVVKSGARVAQRAALVVAYDPFNGASLGLSRLDQAVGSRAAAASIPAGFSTLLISTGVVHARVVEAGADIVNSADDLKADVSGLATAAALPANFNTLSIANNAVAANVTRVAGSAVAGVADFQNSAASIRDALGMASANLDTALAALDAQILTRLATAGYTAPANSDIAAIKTKTDQLAFHGSGGAVVGELTANAAQQVDTAVQGQLTQARLFELFALAVDTDSPPNAASAYAVLKGLSDAIKAVADKLDTMIEPIPDSSDYRFNEPGLAEAPTGGGGFNAQEVRDALKLSPSAGDPAADSIDDKLDKAKLNLGIAEVTRTEGD